MSFVSSLIIILFLKCTDSCPSSTKNQKLPPQLTSTSVPRSLPENAEKHESSNIKTDKIDHSLISTETSSQHTSTIPQPPFDFAQVKHTCEDDSKALHSLTVSNMTK